MRTRSSSPCPPKFIALAIRLADAAGIVARRYFRTGVKVLGKDGVSPVTITDREAELRMREMIARAFPDQRHRRRGAPRRSARCRIRPDPRPDRRHEVLHLRCATLRHADRARAPTPVDPARALDRRGRAAGDRKMHKKILGLLGG